MKCFSTVVIAAACVLCVLSARSAPYAGEAATREQVFQSQNATEGYANSYPGIHFVTNFISQNLDPFHDLDQYPTNMAIWGGTGVTASDNRMYADAFFRDDVLFMYEKPSTIQALLQYLTLDHGPVQAELLAQLGANTYVTDISQVTPGEDYTGWYEQNGMTYYFRDGQALTGTQTIDGEEYTFTSVGFQARLLPVYDNGTVIYTTDAYSLITED